MNPEEIKQRLEAKFPKEILSWTEKNPLRIYVAIKPEALPAVARHLFEEMKFRFNIATAVHTLTSFQILYHFSYDRQGMVLSLRVELGQDNPEVDSIAGFLPAADWIEREIFDLFGIKFKGRAEMERLLMSEDWPEGVYPLRKDFEGKG